MLVFDLETDGLLDELTRIHVIHVADTATGQRLRFNGGVYADGSPAPRDGTIEDAVRLLQDAEEIGGHNVIGFDIPAIQKLFPWFEPKGHVRDSLVEARVIWTTLGEIDAAAVKRGKRPETFVKHGLIGSHKLEAWGYRLGEYKGEFKGPWDAFTQEMDEYGWQDIPVTVKLFEKIDSKGYSREALDLELEVQKIVLAQERHGVLFDKAEAEKLLVELLGKRADLDQKLRESFKPWWEPERKGGMAVVFDPKRPNRTMGYTPGAPFTKVKLISFNPASRDHIANRMQTLYGWKPQEFTDGGKPKVDETTLAGLDYPEAKLLTEYLTVEKRLGQLAEGNQAWLKWVRDDGRIHGRVNPMGTITHRASHSSPNLGQVPSAKSPYGHECRRLFKVPPGRIMVGVDAEGVQLRLLGHYMARFDGGTYADAVANGDKSKGTDAHSLNRDAIGMNDRERAKTFIYAYILGAGGWKLGQTVYEDFTDAQRASFNARNPLHLRDDAFAKLGVRSKRSIEKKIPALRKLQELIREKGKRGYILGLDGRKLTIRSLHTALASVLQGGEAVVMKWAMVEFHRRARERGWVWGVDYAQVLWVHDEWQFEVYRPEIAEEVGQLAADCIRDAGIHFNLKVPLAGSANIGPTWDETH